MADFAMPQALELEASRRNAIPAVRRQVFHDTTTQNQYRPGELCYIPVETGAAGAFMDTTCTRLEMTIKVRNKNHFTDFINLPRCGWNAIIQEFGIEINNGLHMNNRHYAECIEAEMIKSGENRTPFEMCRSNPHQLGNGRAGKYHINFVKPSMVTNLGLPHNVIFPSLTTSTTATTSDIISDNLLFRTNEYAHESFGRVGNSNLFATSDANIIKPVYGYVQGTFSTNDLGNNIGGFQSSSLGLPFGAWDDRVPMPVGTNTKVSNAATFESTTAHNTGTTIGSLVNAESQYRVIGLPSHGSEVGHMSKVTAHNFEANPSTAIYLYNSNYGQSVSESCAAQWPSKQPCNYHELQKQYKQNLRFVNSQNVINYYANTKNIPVGIPLDLSANDSGKSTIWGSKDHTKPDKTEYAQYGAETEFHVQLKVYNCLIGELAKKWFPELITPQGRMRIRMRFQEPNVLFQTLIDPCRRVPGTSRDWFPYLGVVESSRFSSTDGTTFSKTQEPIGSLSHSSILNVASGIHPVMVANYTEGQMFNDAIAMGEFVVPQMRMKSLHQMQFNSDWSELLGEDTNGGTKLIYDFDPLDAAAVKASSGIKDFFNYAVVDDTSGDIIPTAVDIKLNTLAVGITRALYELRQNQEYGFPWRMDAAGTHETLHAYGSANGQPHNDYSPRVFQIRDVQQLNFPQDWRNQIDDTALSGTIITSNSTTATHNPSSDPTWDRQYKAVNYNPFCIPTPQYVPIADPSNKLLDRNIKPTDYVNESYSCFGTHLPASVAQVRRSHRALYPLNIPDSITSKIDERLTYVVENVRLVTQQIILPQTAADSIIQAALSGGISIETEDWKEMESMLPQAETQKHLINMAAAFCPEISFYFRPVDSFQGDQAYGYNSFSFYNPFTSFHYEFDNSNKSYNNTPASQPSDYNNLGGKPIYYNEMLIANRIPIDVQLQLQAELLPRTAIDTLNLLLLHTRWGDQIFTNTDYLELDPRLQPSYQTQKGMVVNTLQDGFFACFVPISALDDQTITCNPFFTPLEISLRKKLRGDRAKNDALPIYKPFDGTFHLSWNLAAFMGQNGRMRTGIPIVNNNMFLRFDKAHMCRDYHTQLLTIATVDGRAVWERGGTFQYFT